MNRADVMGVLAMLQTAYPSFYAKQSDQQMREAVNLWTDLFADDPAPVVYAAVKSIIVAGGAFPPSIGEIKNRMHDLTTPAGLSETEAWALVSKAISNGIYGYEKEFAALPPEVQTAVGSQNQLREWAMMDIETVQSVVASNFMRGYKTACRREREVAMLPESVRALLDGVGDKLMLEGKA